MHVSRTCCKRSKSQPTNVKSTDSKSTLRFFSSRSPSKRLRKLVSTDSREGDCWLKLTSTANNLKCRTWSTHTHFTLHFAVRTLSLPKVHMQGIITTNFLIVNMCSYYGCKETPRKVPYLSCGKVHFWSEEKNSFRTLDKNSPHQGLLPQAFRRRAPTLSRF